MNIARLVRQTPDIRIRYAKRRIYPAATNACSSNCRQATRAYICVPSRGSLPLRNRLPSALPVTAQHAYSTATTARGRLRVAIIGSGPAGFYSAHRLMKNLQDAVVDMYEKLPTPYGLVRFGVAPDHPEVKNCQRTFEDIAASPRFNYIGNVCVGSDVHLAQMQPHYDAILFAYGASEDKKLGIPGEDARGVYSAREFVGWYNGLPEFRDLRPILNHSEEAIIVGHGNVALDVARILLTPGAKLAKTDITQRAINVLVDNQIKSVRIVGRRGPIQASFTAKEVRELINLPYATFSHFNPAMYPPQLSVLPRAKRRIGEILLKDIGRSLRRTKTNRRWALDFLMAPKAVIAPWEHISSMTFTKQRFPASVDRFDPFAPVIPTDEEVEIKATAAFLSVGYKSKSLPGFSELGIPFHTGAGVIPNDTAGRVISSPRIQDEPVAEQRYGFYCAGWVKNGPKGVIADTMKDAFYTADMIAQDWLNNVPFMNSGQGKDLSSGRGWDAVKEHVLRKGVRPISWADWMRIDHAERERGRNNDKPREKFLTYEAMLHALDS